MFIKASWRFIPKTSDRAADLLSRCGEDNYYGYNSERMPNQIVAISDKSYGWCLQT